MRLENLARDFQKKSDEFFSIRLKKVWLRLKHIRRLLQASVDATPVHFPGAGLPEKLFSRSSRNCPDHLAETQMGAFFPGDALFRLCKADEKNQGRLVEFSFGAF